MTRHIRPSKRTWLIAAVGVCLFAAQALPGAMANAAPASHGVRPNARWVNSTATATARSRTGGFPQAALHRHPRHQRPLPALLRQRPLHRPRRAVDPVPVQPPRLRQQRDLHRDPPPGPGGDAGQQPSRSRRHPLVRALPGAVVRDDASATRTPTRRPSARPTATTTRRTARSPAAAPRSWRCSSTRPASPRSATRSAATTPTGARRSTSTRSRPPTTAARTRAARSR